MPITSQQKRELAASGLRVIEVQIPAEKRDKSSGRNLLPNNPNHRSTRQEAKTKMTATTETNKHAAAHTAHDVSAHLSSEAGAAAADALGDIGIKVMDDVAHMRQVIDAQTAPKQQVRNGALFAAGMATVVGVVYAGASLATYAFKRSPAPAETTPSPLKK